jgi:hypothetical protein
MPRIDRDDWQFLVAFAPFMFLIWLCGALIIWDEEETRKKNEVITAKNKVWADKCRASGGHVVTHSWKEKRFNYRDRYYTYYRTYCEK